MKLDDELEGFKYLWWTMLFGGLKLVHDEVDVVIRPLLMER